jgi:hypothetical protein
MRKYILLILSFYFLTIISAHSQSLLANRYGVKAGFNMANLSSIIELDGVKNIEKTPNSGFDFGFYMEIPLNDKIYLNPELLYSQKSISFNYSYTFDYPIDNRDEYTTSHTIKQGVLQLNSILSYKVNYKLSINVGPSVAFLLSNDYSYSEQLEADPEYDPLVTLEDGEFNEESFDLGVDIGISYYLTDDLFFSPKIYIGLLQSGEVLKPIDLLTEDPSYTLKNRAYTLSVGYLF